MAEQDKPVFRVNGRDYPIPETFTVGEMCDAEKFFGVEFGDEKAASSMRLAAALLWIAIRREDATVTVEDIRALPPEVFEAVAEKGDARPPSADASDSDSEISGGSSGNGSAPLEADQSPSGIQDWVTGATSDHVTSPS